VKTHPASRPAPLGGWPLLVTTALALILLVSACGGDSDEGSADLASAEVTASGLLEVRSDFEGSQTASLNADVTSIHYRSIDEPIAGYVVTTAVDIDGNVYELQRIGLDQETGEQTVEQQIGGALERNDYAELVILVNSADLRLERDANQACPLVGITTLEVNWKDGNGIAGPLPAVAGDCTGYGLRGNIEAIAGFLLSLGERVS